MALHRALDAGSIPHAFGGAIALAYWTLDPRATSDIDINIFVPAEECGAALAALAGHVDQPPGTADVIARAGQIRLWWDETPLDLFFDYAPIHADAARHTSIVPSPDARIPVLGPVELAVFKAMFDRTRDWADVEAMRTAGTLEGRPCRRRLDVRTMYATASYVTSSAWPQPQGVGAARGRRRLPVAVRPLISTAVVSRCRTRSAPPRRS